MHALCIKVFVFTGRISVMAEKFTTNREYALMTRRRRTRFYTLLGLGGGLGIDAFSVFMNNLQLSQDEGASFRLHTLAQTVTNERSVPSILLACYVGLPLILGALGRGIGKIMEAEDDIDDHMRNPDYFKTHDK